MVGNLFVRDLLIFFFFLQKKYISIKKKKLREYKKPETQRIITKITTNPITQVNMYVCLSYITFIDIWGIFAYTVSEYTYCFVFSNVHKWFLHIMML